MGTAEELLATVCQMLDEQHSDARKARQMAREARRDAAMDRIGAMRTAADFQLAAGIAQGAGQAASGAAGIAGAGGGAEGGVDPTWKGAGDMASGAGTGAGGALSAIASMNSADGRSRRRATALARSSTRPCRHRTTAGERRSAANPQ
jgi:hypothetical protein